MKVHYVYLLKLREHIKSNENIFKIGKTTQLNSRRFIGYPKGSIVLFQIICSDCHKLEDNIKKFFKIKYEQMKEYGDEYFKGDYKDMIKDIFVLSDSCLNINFTIEEKESEEETEVEEKIENEVEDKQIKFKESLTGSKILECSINRVIFNKLKYMTILIEIYKLADIETIIKNTTFNVKKEKFLLNGYSWYEDIKLSIQGKDSNDTFKEIIRMIELLRVNFEIKILLKNKEVVDLKF
jgi:hypothetical protein